MLPRDSDAHGDFDVLPARELRAKYGLTAENRPKVALRPIHVPETLHSLIPLAEEFGIADDLIREDYLAKASPESRRSLRQAVAEKEDELQNWLGGPAADVLPPTPEYVAFACLVMAAECALS